MGRKSNFSNEDRKTMAQYITKHVKTHKRVYEELANAYGVHWKTIEKEYKKSKNVNYVT